MTTFKVGEVVRLVMDDSTVDQDAINSDGKEAVVTGGLGYYLSSVNGVLFGELWGYEVRTTDGADLVCEPHELRKKYPPNLKIEAYTTMLDCIKHAKQSSKEPA